MTSTSTIAAAETSAGSSLSLRLIRRDGVSGMLVRGVIITFALALVTLLLVLLQNQGLAFELLELPVILGISVVVWFAMMLGVFFSEYPRGDQAALSRVGLATFCRTGLPLLVVLMAVNYATRLNSVALCVGVLYAVGLSLSLALEVCRLGTSVTGILATKRQS